MFQATLLNTHDLLPKEWSSIGDGPLYAFNPALLKYNNEWIFAYRMVGLDAQRRIGICRLDKHFQIISNSILPFSDFIVPPVEPFLQWFADPRLYHLGGRIYIYWNNGWHDLQNAQYLQEIDPQTLQPLGFPRELILLGERQHVEKNWTFFSPGHFEASEGPFYAVYSINPHRILTMSLEGTGPIILQTLIIHDWDSSLYSNLYGQLRGGTPPILLEDRYYSFAHSLYFIEDKLHYTATVYSFSAQYPFRPLQAPSKPLVLYNPLGSKTNLQRLNPAVTSVIYPCGAHFEAGEFIISYGVNDELCLIARVPFEEIIRICD